MAIFGTSSGGGLAAAVILRLRDLNILLPAAAGLGTPWVDITRTGDTLYTNEQIDDVLVLYGGLIDAAAKLYAGPADMKDPLLSPIYGDFSKGFPPTILTSGTRDLLLSCTVRMHRKLRQAGIKAELQVFEGMSHAEYLLIPGLPEGEEAFQEISTFLQQPSGQIEALFTSPGQVLAIPEKKLQAVVDKHDLGAGLTGVASAHKKQP